MMYDRVMCNERPQKAEINKTPLTVGGNRINYPHECGTPPAHLMLVKLLLNSVISTRNAKFRTLGIKNFYLNTLLQRYEYLRLKLEQFPADVIKEYGLAEKYAKMVMSTLKYTKGCTDYPKQVFWPNNY